MESNFAEKRILFHSNTKGHYELNEEQKKHRITILRNSGDHYKMILDPMKHEELRQNQEVRLSYRATLAALLIHLYRDEPILRAPFILLVRLVEVDEYMTTSDAFGALT